MSFYGSTWFYLEIVKGNIDAHNPIIHSGRNMDIDAAAKEDIWDGGGDYPYLTSAETLDISSDNVNDTFGGSGAESVTVFGLDGNLDFIFETKNLNGTTPVTTVKSYFRSFRMSNSSAQDAVGVIQAIATTSVVLQMQITNAGEVFNQTQMSMFTVPNTMLGFVLNWWGSMNAATLGASADPAATLELYVRPVGEVFQVKDTRGLAREGTSAFDAPFPCPLIVPEGADVKIRASVTDDNTDITGGYGMLVVDEALIANLEIAQN